MNRRRFVGGVSIGLGTAMLGMYAAAPAGATADPSAVLPFHINVPESELADLRERISATRWPDRELVSDSSQGVQLATIRTISEYWASDYNWRKIESRLNALPQFMTNIDGISIHFIHVRSKHEGALPLIVTHGWPGSIIEQLKIIDPLTNPTAYGASASDAFHLVIPSVPGYGFSSRPTTTGWGPPRIAQTWVKLMKRLGYNRFAAQGGDIGAAITNAMGAQAPPELLGMHTNLAGTIPKDEQRALALGSPPPSSLSADEKRAFEQVQGFAKKHGAYSAEMSTRPQALYSLADSPVALAAWILDHGDGYGQPAAVMESALLGTTVNRHAADGLTRDDVLDNMTLYWLTNTGISSARFYWERMGASPFNAVDVYVPAAVSAFPGEIYTPPRSWAARAYHDLIYYNNEIAAGGHFAAWEQPQLFSQEVRNGLRPLRAKL
jgi:pimeloyl-ACP methyl ester carboxylesterase